MTGRLRVLAVALLAQGCAAWLHPASTLPPLPIEAPPRYRTEAPAQAEATPRAEESAKPAKSKAADEPWWTAFGDPALDRLIREAHARNFALRDLSNIYHADLVEKARTDSPFWPLQIGVPAVVQRSRAGNPAALGAPAYAVTNNEAGIGVAATYQLDLWGQLGVQGTLLADAAEAQAQNAEMSAQNVAVQVAQTWFDILAQRALLALLEQRVRLNQDLQALVKGRFELHLTTRLAVLQQEQQLLNVRGQVPLIKARLALLGSQLSLLLGRAPAADTDLVPKDRDLPDLPAPPSAGAPADLVKTSPEVRLAQVRVVEAEHRLNQNRASWLPEVSVFLNGGLQAFDLKQPFNFDPMTNGSSFQSWSFGARLTWPIFDGGQRQTEAKTLQMSLKRRNLFYEQTFLEAVRRVQDAQVLEAKQADNVKALRAEVELGKQVLTEARQLYEQGSSDYLAVLTALSNLEELENTLLLARRILLSHRIDLYRALGGTWSRSIVDALD
jgi:outer membrane protein TolC